MRPPVRSVLSAVVVTVAVLTGACTTNSTIDAAAPEAQADRGVASDPLPVATPTVSSSTSPLPTPDTDSSPSVRPSPSQDTDEDAESGLANIEPVEGRDPAYFVDPIITKASDFVPTSYAVRPNERTVGRAFTDGPTAAVPISGLTPDGRHLWVAMTDPEQETNCPDANVGTALGVIDLRAGGEPRRVEPIGGLPKNISQVHYGPDGHALLYTSCGNKSQAAALARVTPEGDFTDIRELDPAFAESVWVGEPRWGRGFELGNFSFENTGELMVLIPQRGLAAPGDTTQGGADVYLAVDRNEIVEVWPNETILETTLVWGNISSDGDRVYGTYLEATSLGQITKLAPQRGFTASGVSQTIAAGSSGAHLLGVSRAASRVETITDRPVSDVAWAPIGDWFVVTGPDGTTLHNGLDEGTELSSAPGDSVYFTSDGATLVVAELDEYRIFTFANLAPNSPAVGLATLTNFSILDSGGLGPIRAGMMASQLNTELGYDINIDGIDGIEVGYCVWIDVPDLPGIWILGEATSETDAVIKRVSVNAGPWKTPSGLRLGSSEAEVYDALGSQIEARPHAYTAGNYLDFIPADDADPFNVQFETNGHQVVQIHVGDRNWTPLIEGCA